MFTSICRLSPDLVESGTNQPKNRVNHKEREHAREEHVHKEPYKIERRVQLAIMGVSVRLILHEAQVRAGVTPSAGHDKVGLVDGRTRIRRRIDFVRTVAIPAARGLDVSAEGAKLRVEGIAVSGELFFMARSADRRGLHAEF